MSLQEWNLILEVINGVWGLLALILMMMCGQYLLHEMLARKIKVWRSSKWTQGMRVATAIAAMSAGVCITRMVVYAWQFSGATEPFTLAQTGSLIGGATIGTVGFICAIREISKPLYGDWPWMLAMAAVAVMTAYTAIYHYY